VAESIKNNRKGTKNNEKPTGKHYHVEEILKESNKDLKFSFSFEEYILFFPFECLFL